MFTPRAEAATGSCDIAVIETPVRLRRNQIAIAPMTMPVTRIARTLDVVMVTPATLSVESPHGSPMPSLSVPNAAVSTARIRMPNPRVPISTASCEWAARWRTSAHWMKTMKTAAPRIASATARPNGSSKRPGPNQ